VQFRVDDCWVRSVHTEYQDPVCRDSCVEFFVQPHADAGYFNFEMNAGGALHVWYIQDSTRTINGFAQGEPVSAHLAAGIVVESSLPATVFPELQVPTHWRLGCRIPFSVLETTQKRALNRTTLWRCNFYKLGSGTSHPHWASWNPIGEALDFHCPAHFGTLEFK
jgi:hypothetical protein